MPPFKSVETLFHKCNVYAARLIIKFLDQFSHLECYEQEIHLNNLNKYLQCNLHPFILDGLLSYYTNIFLRDSQKLMLIKMYIHPFMKTFYPKFKLPYRKGFYEFMLNDLKKLVFLNLSMVCTDEVLEVVGQNCPVLQVIYITSKIESATNKSKRALNALKLKFFVSDNGLKHLHNCKYLKCIFMNKVIRSSCGGRKITHEGIRCLLRFLPNLEFISYSDMGLVLEGWQGESPSLRLTHLHDNHITPHHIDIFSQILPSLKNLCIFLPTTTSDASQVPAECLQHLVNSNLNLTSVILKFFPYNNSLKLFFTIKGIFLTKLSIHNEISLTEKIIVFIGQTCPNLKYLDVRILHSESPDQLNSLSMNQCTYFGSLECLIIFGDGWDPRLIFSMCIYNAINMQTLILMNRNYTANLDEEFRMIMKKNPLTKLREVSLFDGINVSVESLVQFVLQCPNLKEITLKENNVYESDLRQIKTKYNFDLNIKSHSELNLNHCFCYI